MSKFTFQRTKPENVGISATAISDFILDTQKKGLEMHSIMVLRGSKVAGEAWWKPYSKDLPHMLFSLSKSFTSTAVSLVIGDGLLSVEDSVCSHFPDNLPETISDNLAAMKVKHLLSMNTGHTFDTTGEMMGSGISFATAFLSLEVEKAPGTHFLYNTGASYILSAIVQRLTGKTVNDLLNERIYCKLGIDLPKYDTCPEGINLGGFGLHTKTEDIAKLGQLYLNKGMWQGEQLLDPQWVEMAGSFQSDNSSMDDIDWAQGYGYQFWLCRHNAYRGDGAFGQYCIIMPEKDAIIAITSGVNDMQAVLSSVWDILLPAMGERKLEENLAANDKLQDLIGTLKYEMMDINRESKIMDSVNGKTYTLEQNELGIEEISLSYNNSNYVLSMKNPKTSMPVKLGIGEWNFGSGIIQ